MRFSLKSMMICVLVVAILCGISFSLPAWLSRIALSSSMLILPAVLVTGIIFGTVDQRTFAIGASATFGTMILADGPVKNLLRFNSLGRIDSTVTVLLTFLLLACAGGTAIWTRRWLVAHGDKRSVNPPPLPAAAERDRSDDA